ncbi:MAG: hypothetical protein FWG90_12685 [Oscillospiraceae bacterium]|nr:hypothetical protein [Oscillospiraceae bacterium]
MAKKVSSSCTLPKISKGQRMMIYANSACGSTASIILKDDKETYATIKKGELSHLSRFLGQEIKLYNGGSNLRLEIEMEHPSYDIAIKPIVTFTDTVDALGKSHGGVYNIAVEDYKNNTYSNLSIVIAVNTPN